MMRKALVLLTLFIGVGAVVGASMMWIDPTGALLGVDTLLVILREKLPVLSVMFQDFILSGFMLLLVNGVTQLAAATLLIKKHTLGVPASLACGIILMVWICMEWWLFGYIAICNLFFALGLVETVLAYLLLRKRY